MICAAAEAINKTHKYPRAMGARLAPDKTIIVLPARIKPRLG